MFTQRKFRHTLAATLGLLAICLLASFARAQDQQKMTPEQQKQMMDQMMAAMKPGPEQAKLKEMAGTWDCIVKFYPPEAPGTTAESKGTAKMEMILGDRYLAQHFDGEMPMGPGQMMPFHGMGITGYDNAEKKYVGIWCDDMGTGIMMTKGTCDGNVMTMEGEFTDPMSKQMTKVKEVATFVDKDHHKFEMFMTGPKGDMPKMMEIMYTRKS